MSHRFMKENDYLHLLLWRVLQKLPPTSGDRLLLAAGSSTDVAECKCKKRVSVYLENNSHLLEPL